MSLPVRPELVGAAPYGAPQLDVPVRLNVNENPFPLPPQVVEAMAARVREVSVDLNRYPDRDADTLRAKLADYLGHGLSSANVWAANGSNEVMTHLLQVFAGPGRRVLSFGPTYSMYPEYARNTWSEYVQVPRSADFTIDVDAAVAAIAEHRPSVVIVTTPNNPSGTLTPASTITALLEAGEHVLVVDEAYQEFAPDGAPSALELLAQHPRLVVTRTMSKAFGLAGGRLGYLAASADVVDLCRVVRLPYHLSAVTQAVAEVALDHAGAMMEQVQQLREQRDRLTSALSEQGLQVADSAANFVLFGRFADRHQVWQDLVDRGVLIREVGPSGWLRVSAGQPAETEQFLDALAEVLPSAERMDT